MPATHLRGLESLEFERRTMIFSCPVSSTSSPAVMSSSKSFSPGHQPGELDLDLRRVLAREDDQVAGQVRDRRTGLPIFSTNISPPRPWAPAWTMSWAASGMVTR